MTVRPVAGRDQHRHQRLGDMHRAITKAAQRRVEDLDEDAAFGVSSVMLRSVRNASASPQTARRRARDRPDGLAPSSKAVRRFAVGRQRHRAACRVGGNDRVEITALHSTARQRSAILPPQASPTSQACSSVTPKSRSRGSPSAMTSCACRSPRPRRSRRNRADDGAVIGTASLAAGRPRRGAPGLDDGGERHPLARVRASRRPARGFLA